MIDWKPMETAPTDGTEILIWRDFATVPIVNLAWYRKKEDNPDFDEEDIGWWTYPEHSVTQIKLEGTGYSPEYWTEYTPPLV